MSFSAVIATSASPSRRERLLEIIRHICEHELLDEVIVVWQSSDLPSPEFDHPKLKVFLCAARAVSLARNLGAFQATGRWVWFLDDDTIPASDAYLNKAKTLLEETGLDFLTSNVCGEGVGQVCRRISVDVPLDRDTVWGNFWEPGLIVTRSAFLQVPYDICLGPGCLHGSSEGSDLGMRLLNAGYRGTRVHHLELDHPRIDQPDDYRNKLFFYALGNGLVAVRHRGKSGLVWMAAKCAGKSALFGLTFRFSDALNQLVRLCGLLVGPSLRPSPPMNLETSLLDSGKLLKRFEPEQLTLANAQ